MATTTSEGYAMDMKLTDSQIKFLESAKKGNYRRTAKDPTGVALYKRGLVFFALFFGWNLTGEGILILDELKNKISDK